MRNDDLKRRLGVRHGIVLSDTNFEMQVDCRILMGEYTSLLKVALTNRQPI